jgi:hypothetical protein
VTRPMPPGWRARPSRTARTARAAVILAVTGAVLLGGCAQSPGTAAVVEGRTISENQLQQAQADLDTLLPNRIDPQTVLVALMVGPFFIDAAAANGVGVSDAQARDLAQQIAAQGGGQVGSLGEGALEVLRFTLASDNLTRLPQAGEVIGDVERRIFEADIDVSPRYGDLDQETGQLVRPASPWIGAPRP